MKPQSDAKLIARLSASDIFRDYQRAFGETTGLPLKLTAVDDWKLAHHGGPHENPFCAIMATSNKTCSACLQAQQEISNPNAEEPRTVVCFAGLCETSVPLRVGEKLIGFLKTGEVMVERPKKRHFTRTARQLLDWGLTVDFRELEEAFFQSRTLTRKQYDSMVRLLAIFAQHLSLVANQLMVQEQNSEPPAITKARRFIAEHQAEELPLEKVARAANMSAYYFCKMFKKATGLNFTEYLSRLRVEKAKNLLLNPNARVTEVAFDTGFTSITNFNRTFRRLVGQSPTEYRRSLPQFAPRAAAKSA